MRWPSCDEFQKISAPNFADPRMQRRAIKALDWVLDHLDSYHFRKYHSLVISKVFGGYNNGTGNYLRCHLIESDDEGEIGKMSNGYRQKFHNINKLISILEKHLPGVYSDEKRVERLIDRIENDDYYTDIKQQILTGKFSYYCSSFRHWHKLQFVRRTLKQSIWNHYGYVYDYDIKACAATMLLGQARLMQPNDQRLDIFENYIKNSRSIRKLYAERTGLTEDSIKEIIAAMINGAPLHADQSIGDIVRAENKKRAEDNQHDVKKVIDELRNDVDFRQFRASLAFAWKQINFPQCVRDSVDEAKEHDSLKIFNNGKPQLTGQLKCHHYFYMEQKALRIITQHLEDDNNRYFSEHDGWKCVKPVNIAELEQKLLNALGFSLQLELK